MKIQFESSPDHYSFPYRIIGSAGRYDTITDCAFLDDTHIVCADRQMAKLYIIRFDLTTQTHTILDSKECIVNGRPQHFELISIKDNIVYGVIFEGTLFMCKIQDNAFCNFESVSIDPKATYHGLSTTDHTSVYVTNTQLPTITEFNIPTRTKRSSYTIPQGKRIKDIAVIDKDHLLVLSSDGAPSNAKHPTKDVPLSRHCKSYNSHVLIYNKATLKTIKSYALINTHVDSCVYLHAHCFVTCTPSTGESYIFHAKLDSQYNFTDPTNIPCAPFPHGISIYNDILAYSSYGESAIYIHTIDKEGNIDTKT